MVTERTVGGRRAAIFLFASCSEKNYRVYQEIVTPVHLIRKLETKYKGISFILSLLSQ